MWIDATPNKEKDENKKIKLISEENHRYDKEKLKNANYK